jgi:hypothetical protein
MGSAHTSSFYHLQIQRSRAVVGKNLSCMESSNARPQSTSSHSSTTPPSQRSLSTNQEEMRLHHGSNSTNASLLRGETRVPSVRIAQEIVFLLPPGKVLLTALEAAEKVGGGAAERVRLSTPLPCRHDVVSVCMTAICTVHTLRAYSMMPRSSLACDIDHRPYQRHPTTPTTLT